MKRFLITAAAVAAMIVPTAVVAQDESPEPSLIGVTTFDVCLAIAGPVIQLTPESLTEGISDGTFVIESLSNDCETGLQAAEDDMTDDDMIDDEADSEDDSE